MVPTDEELRECRFPVIIRYYVSVYVCGGAMDAVGVGSEPL